MRLFVLLVLSCCHAGLATVFTVGTSLCISLSSLSCSFSLHSLLPYVLGVWTHLPAHLLSFDQELWSLALLFCYSVSHLSSQIVFLLLLFTSVSVAKMLSPVFFFFWHKSNVNLFLRVAKSCININVQFHLFISSV